MSNQLTKIGFVLDASLDSTDGVQQYVIDLGEWLREKNYDVHYLVGETKRKDLKNIHSLSKNISVKFNGNRTNIPLPTSKKMLKDFLAKEDFDILHIQAPYSPFLAQRIIQSAYKRTVIIGTFHVVAYSKLVSFSSKLLSFWNGKSLKHFDQMLSTSPASKKFAKKTFGIESRVLPNVIDYHRFNIARSIPEYADNVITILFLGRLVPRKGCIALIESVNLLKNRNDLPEFRLLICGKGPQENQIRDLIAKYKLEDKITLKGFINEVDKPSYYASADISIFPSSGGESFGIVLLEALASGRSVVLGGNNIGYKSVLSPQPDLLFNPKNIHDIANKLSYFMLRKEEAKKMRIWGSQYAKDFDISIIGNELIKIYQKLLTSFNRY